MRVAVVTDTTACLGADRAEAAGVTVVPLHVHVGGGRSVPAREITPEEVVEILAAGKERAATSRPSPGELVETYRRVVAETGCEAIVSVHLSAGVSGTVEAAELARDELAGQVPVEVVDSRVIGLAMGYAVLAGARVAAGGADPGEVAEVVRARAAASRTWFYVDTLEHLRRGGRIGRAAALVGAALAIKPLLTLRDGEVHPAAKVRTRAKALARLVDLAVEAVETARSEGRPVELAVHQLAAEEGAAALAEELRGRTGLTPEIAVLDPVVGVHTGPGTLGVVVAPGDLP
ncbi:DegV family protein [uncultured Ornithinimicrobium sp.]|uniref:DegV family protein n=1 Tax=uncultured Ornithinimicrobium sp. TaxID=259307 RepID=UPI002598CAB6|nr:DegV family protein [uncultured Ornithinimicrobium sp.]